MKLNLGSGASHFDGFLNVDTNPQFEADFRFDLRATPWPLPLESVDEIVFFHCIEHIEKRYHVPILTEIHRILKPEGIFILSYPEFEIILENWLSNFQGQRDFWEANIYGRQTSPQDYHVCAMDSEEVGHLLVKLGFKKIEICAEDKYPQNTVVRCTRGVPLVTYEGLIKTEVIGDSFRPNGTA